MQIRINEPAESKLKSIAERHRRTATAEGQIAVDKHIEEFEQPAPSGKNIRTQPAAKPHIRKRK